MMKGFAYFLVVGMIDLIIKLFVGLMAFMNIAVAVLFIATICVIVFAVTTLTKIASEAASEAKDTGRKLSNKARLFKARLDDTLKELNTEPPPKPEPEPEPEPPKPKPFVLPFALKTRAEFDISTSNSTLSTQHLLKFIRRLGVQYLKDKLYDPDGFVFDGYPLPPCDNDAPIKANADIITKFIHDYIWHIMRENTPIASHHYLPYGSKYTPYLCKLTSNFSSGLTTTGVRIYTESLIDHYIQQVLKDAS